MNYIEATKPSPEVRPPHVKARIKEIIEFQDPLLREILDPNVRSNDEYVKTAQQLIDEGEFGVVKNFFLGSGIVTIDRLTVSEEQKNHLRP